MSSVIRLLFLLDLVSLAAAFHLPESRFLGLVTMDYLGFVLFYRLAQMWQARVYAHECQILVSSYGVSDAVARKLVGYWGDRSRP
jgi:hypothetical protein